VLPGGQVGPSHAVVQVPGGRLATVGRFQAAGHHPEAQFVGVRKRADHDAVAPGVEGIGVGPRALLDQGLPLLGGHRLAAGEEEGSVRQDRIPAGPDLPVLQGVVEVAAAALLLGAQVDLLEIRGRQLRARRANRVGSLQGGGGCHDAPGRGLNAVLEQGQGSLDGIPGVQGQSLQEARDHRAQALAGIVGAQDPVDGLVRNGRRQQRPPHGLQVAGRGRAGHHRTAIHRDRVGVGPGDLMLVVPDHVQADAAVVRLEESLQGGTGPGRSDGTGHADSSKRRTGLDKPGRPRPLPV